MWAPGQNGLEGLNECSPPPNSPPPPLPSPPSYFFDNPSDEPDEYTTSSTAGEGLVGGRAPASRSVHGAVHGWRSGGEDAWAGEQAAAATATATPLVEARLSVA